MLVKYENVEKDGIDDYTKYKGNRIYWYLELFFLIQKFSYASHITSSARSYQLCS
jgi:hypothetical protein